MRLPTQAGYELIKRWESFEASPYLCPAQVWTIGFGCTFDMLGQPVVATTPPVTEEQALLLLQREVEHYAAAVLRLCPVPLTDAQYDALVSFTFNLGAGALQASTLRRKVLQGEFADAAAEFPKWVWAAGRKLKGLLNRRIAERQRFEA